MEKDNTLTKSLDAATALNNFGMHITYKRGDKCVYRGNIIQFKPNKKKPQTSTGRQPEVANGWRIKRRF